MNLILAVILSVLSFVATPAMAQTLSFTGAGCATAPDGTGPLVTCADNLFINQASGDTAAVDVSYLDVILGRSLIFQTSTFADLSGVAIGTEQAGVSLARVQIAPLLVNETVTLDSFDLGRTLSRVTQTNLRVLDGLGTILHDFGVVTIPHDGPHAHFTGGFSSPNGIIIEWGGIETGLTASDTSAQIIGIDNIAFSLITTTPPTETVPEPGTLILIGTGVAGLAIRRRAR